MSKSQLMSDTQIKALTATIIHKPDHSRDYCRIFFPMKFPGLNRASPQAGGCGDWEIEMNPLYIFDLDGTLALIDHRRHFMERPHKEQDWPGFFKACSDDEPNVPVIRVMESLRRFADVWIFSGRSDEVRMQTVDWLVANTSFSPSDFDSAFGTQDVLTMRLEGDYTPDDVLKKQWLDSMLAEDRKRLVAVFDDRDRVVKMWRDNGIACFQVAPGEF